MFFSPHNMGSHSRVHARETIIICPTCGRHFDQHCRFKQHMRQHTGERPYICEANVSLPMYFM